MDFSIAELLGKFEYLEHIGFAKIPEYLADDSLHMMRHECANALFEMHHAAAKDKISLKVISSSRSFQHQQRIWENKWTGKTLTEGDDLLQKIPDSVQRAKQILRFSSMPGTSRHHWGADVDFNELEDEYFCTGRGKEEYLWLTENATKHGFAQPYTSRSSGRKNGYEEEKWHWSYLPLSTIMLQNYISTVDYSMLSGFYGCETAGVLNVIDEYVCGINPVCLPITL